MDFKLKRWWAEVKGDMGEKWYAANRKMTAIQGLLKALGKPVMILLYNGTVLA